jgi:DNA-binding XRE family transcriptional regulator
MQDRTPAPGAAKLKAFRKRIGVSQQRAAQAIDCSGPTFNDWENGKKRPEPKFISRIETWTSGEVALADWILASEDIDVTPATEPSPVQDEDEPAQANGEDA